MRLYLILTAVYGGDKTQELWLVTVFYYWLLPHQQCLSCFLCNTLLWKQTAKQTLSHTHPIPETDSFRRFHKYKASKTINNYTVEFL
jgi:hypothetical protein